MEHYFILIAEYKDHQPRIPKFLVQKNDEMSDSFRLKCLKGELFICQLRNLIFLYVGLYRIWFFQIRPEPDLPDFWWQIRPEPEPEPDLFIGHIFTICTTKFLLLNFIFIIEIKTNNSFLYNVFPLLWWVWS